MNKKQLELFEYSQKVSRKFSQSNKLIEAPYQQEFSIHEIKLFEDSLSKITLADLKYIERRTDKEFMYSTSELAKLLNTKSNVISMEIEKTALRMTKKGLHLRKERDGEVSFTSIVMFTFAEYENGLFKFRLNFEMIPYIIQLNGNFTQFEVHYLMSMSSPNAIKLYKLLLMCKNKYKCLNYVFTVEELKKQFGLSNKYAQYSDFKQRVIEPSLMQINTFTDLNVNYEEIKLGRRVEKLDFKFELKKPEKKQLPNESVIIDVDVYDSQSETNFNPAIESLLASINEDVSQGAKNKLQELYLSRGHDFIEVSISYAKKNAKTNFEKYLLDTLNNDWAVGELKKKLVKKTTAKASQQKREQLNQERDLQIEQDNINRSEIEHLFIKLPDKEQERYAEFAESIFNKHRAKLEKMHCSTESLKLSVFAVSNQRFYNKTIEIYITSMLRTSLSLNDYLC